MEKCRVTLDDIFFVAIKEKRKVGIFCNGPSRIDEQLQILSDNDYHQSVNPENIMFFMIFDPVTLDVTIVSTDTQTKTFNTRIIPHTNHEDAFNFMNRQLSFYTDSEIKNMLEYMRPEYYGERFSESEEEIGWGDKEEIDLTSDAWNDKKYSSYSYSEDDELRALHDYMLEESIGYDRNDDLLIDDNTEFIGDENDQNRKTKNFIPDLYTTKFTSDVKMSGCPAYNLQSVYTIFNNLRFKNNKFKRVYLLMHAVLIGSLSITEIATDKNLEKFSDTMLRVIEQEKALTAHMAINRELRQNVGINEPGITQKISSMITRLG